jgi:hypothetical protein
MQETINRLSRELKLPSDVVIKTYKAYWQFIRHTIEELPLKETMDEQTFSKLRLNFNIPNLGKLACTYSRYVGMKKKNKLISKQEC